MKTKLSPDNPYSYNRYGFVWEHVPEKSEAHLDYGCGRGSFLGSLGPRNVRRLVGVDVSREAVEKAGNAYPHLTFHHLSDSESLPFEEGTFTSISLMDVLEHVHDQKALLHELHRLLRDDGTLIVTVPGQHVFSFLDMGNFKFRFPRLHRWYWRLKISEEDYARRYVSNPDGLIGDVSAQKAWHEHFSKDKLQNLLAETGFHVIGFDGSGLFLRPLSVSCFFVKNLWGIRSLFKWIVTWDGRLFESTNLFCIARKNKIT